MDILLQYLDIKKNVQVFVTITDIPCVTIYQAIKNYQIVDRGISLVDYLEDRDHKAYFLVGIIDARYCNRRTIGSFSYDDFCRLTCGLGE